MSETASSGVEFIGPVEHHMVIVGGRKVPYLTATPLRGGQIYLTLDDRFAVEMSLQDADRLVPFIAHAIAVAGGWTAHPDEGEEPRRSNPMPPCHFITSVTTGAADEPPTKAEGTETP